MPVTIPHRVSAADFLCGKVQIPRIAFFHRLPLCIEPFGQPASMGGALGEGVLYRLLSLSIFISLICIISDLKSLDSPL